MLDLTKLLQCKWESGGRGPERFDCWGLVCYIYEQHGVNLPSYVGVRVEQPKIAYSTITNGLADPVLFTPLKVPEHLCIVAMGKNQKLLTHVGVYLDVDDGVVIHIMNGAGVLLQSFTSLKTNQWSRLEFYRYQNAHNN